jgi:hypothetical protein
LESENTNPKSCWLRLIWISMPSRAFST